MSNTPEDLMKNFGNLDSLMKQAQEVQQKMQSIQDDLTNTIVVGKAGTGPKEGSGAVEVTMTCRHDVKKVEILDEDLLDLDEKDILEDLLAAAVNSAVQKIEKMSKDKMLDFTKSLGLPTDFNKSEE